MDMGRDMRWLLYRLNGIGEIYSYVSVYFANVLSSHIDVDRLWLLYPVE
jgi:hypothetical protein